MRLRSAVTRSAVVFILAGVTACMGGPRQRPVQGGAVDEGKGSVVAARQFLEGRWTLESFEVFPPGRPAITLKGSGTLNYDDFGNLRMEIRTDDKSADLLRAAGVDIRDNMISSDGRTVVDMQNKTLTYILEGQKFATSASGPLAANRPRHWEVEGNRLTLTTKDQAGKPLSVGRWTRMP